MNVVMRDADEIQALIRHHASVIVTAIDDGGIKPSKQAELERTCGRMLELAKALGACELERRGRSADIHRRFTKEPAGFMALSKEN